MVIFAKPEAILNFKTPFAVNVRTFESDEIYHSRLHSVANQGLQDGFLSFSKDVALAPWLLSKPPWPDSSHYPGRPYCPVECLWRLIKLTFLKNRLSLFTSILFKFILWFYSFAPSLSLPLPPPFFSFPTSPLSLCSSQPGAILGLTTTFPPPPALLTPCSYLCQCC